MAGRCVRWPEAIRLEVIFLGASSTHTDEIVLQSVITEAVGVAKAVENARWTPERLQPLRPLLDRPDTLGLPPENVMGILGRREQYASDEWACEILDVWKIPDSNVEAWDVDHFGLLVRLHQTNDAQTLIMEALDRVDSPQEALSWVTKPYS